MLLGLGKFVPQFLKNASGAGIGGAPKNLIIKMINPNNSIGKDILGKK